MINITKTYILTIILCCIQIYSVSAWGEVIGWKKTKAIAVPDDIPLFDKDGEKHYLEEYEGKTLLIVFWASWSSPCSEELMNLDLLKKDFRKLAFDVLAISEDYQGIKAIEEFYKQHNIRHLEVLHDYNNQLFKAFSVIGMPTTFLINAEGMNLGHFDGNVMWHDDNVRKLLLENISGNPAEPKNSYKAPSLNQNVRKEMVVEKATDGDKKEAIPPLRSEGIVE